MEKLDTRGLSMSFAATSGIVYLVLAALAIIAPSIAARFSNVFSSAVDNAATAAANNPGLTAGTFFIGLIVAVVAGLAVGALVGSMYNAFVENMETSEVRHARATVHHAR